MSPYQVRLAPSAATALKKLPADVRARVTQGLQKLAADAGRPGRRGGKTVKAIRGVADTFQRLRVGEHRVMFDVVHQDRVILVLGIVQRGDLERWIRNR